LKPRRASAFNKLLGLLAIIAALGGSWPGSSSGQVIRGFVTDFRDGEPLEGATVALRQDSVIAAGAATDRDGFFALSRFPAGRYLLTVSYVGFLPVVDTVRVGREQILLRNYQLTASEEALEELLVEGDRDTGLARVDAGKISIRPADIALVPSPDVSGDLINYLSAIPGLVTVGDRGGQLFVRGGEPWQNLVLLDGMWIYQPFHVLGFFSAFPSDILSQVDVYAGGYGSEFGGRISSVIDVRSRTGSKRRYSGAVSAAPFVTSALLEGPVADDRLSFLISVRESVLEQGAENLVSEPLPFAFGDLFAKLHGLLTSNSQISLTMLRTHDAGKVGEAFQGSGLDGQDQARWNNQAYGIRYLVLPKNFPVLADFNVSYSRLQTGFGDPDDPIRSGRLGALNTTADVTHFSGDIEVKWGIFARTMEISSELGGLYQNLFRRHEFVTEVGMYVEPSIRLDNGMEGSAGVRLNNFPSKNVAFLEPRLRGSWDRGVDRLSIAAGIYHQEIIGLTDRRDAAGVFTAWTTVPFSTVPSSTHFIVGYSRDVGRQLSLGLEAYHKRLNGLFVPEWTAFPRFTTNLQPATGRVWGGDFRIEARGEHFLTTITYGLSSVRYRAGQESLLLWYGADEISYRPAHDRRHQLNVLSAYRTNGFALSVRWQFGSGLPYSRALGFDGFVLLDEPVDVFSEPGSRRVIYEEPFNGTLPTYHRLDISAEKQFPVPGGQLTAQAGVINVYDRSNLFYLDTFTLTRINQLPFIPTFGLKYGFGQ
jgi:carboxypeptidase family protein/TonB-dependent receptor-like protein